VGKYGPAIIAIPGPLKAALNKLKPIIEAIKVSSVWKPSMENPLKLAEDMGHSVETALLHYKQ